MTQATNLQFPATSSQTRFYFLEQANADFNGNNLGIQWELVGNFSNESVERALQTVIARHEILRTRLVERDGEIFQQVIDHVPFRLGVIELRNLPQTEQQTRIKSIARELSADRFDLTKPCPLRVTLLRFAPDRATLLIAVHHAVFDGYSIKVMGRELGELVAAAEERRKANLPELELQYGDYANWQAACADADARTISEEFWRKTLSDAPYFEVPADHAPPPLTGRNGQRLDVPLPKSFHTRLQAAAKELEQSRFSIGAAAMAIALNRLTGQFDLSFATPVVGRDAPELETLLGAFINPLVLRLPLGKTSDVSGALNVAKTVVQSALEHSDHPFDDIVRALGQRPDPNRTPLVSILFGLQSVFLEEQDYGPISLVSIPSATPGITHDLSVQITGREAGWQLMIDFDADRFEPETIQTLADTLLQAFEDVFDARETTLTTGEAILGAIPEALDNIEDQTDNCSETDTKSRLADVWSDLLDLPSDKCDADFFDLGGHSLLALKLLTRVQDKFGVRPSIAEFLASPTLTGLANIIETRSVAHTGDAEPSWIATHLSHGPEGSPVIVTVNQPFLYYGLPRHAEAGVISLQLADHVEIPEAENMVSLCREAANLINEQVCKRPLVVLGNCVDGVMARAIAEHLSDPPLLVLVDAWAPRAAEELTSFQVQTRRWARRLKRWYQHGRMKARGHLSWVEFFAKFRPLAVVLKASGKIEAVSEDILREERNNVRLHATFQLIELPAYRGEAILFRTSAQQRDARSRMFGWKGKLSSDTPIFELDGWHEDALRGDAISGLTDVLNARLRRLRS